MAVDEPAGTLVAAAWDESLHPRVPGHHHGGGEFTASLHDLSDWANGKDGAKAVAKARKATNPEDPANNHGTKEFGDLVLKAVAHQQGWDAPGKTGTAKELDDLVHQGGTEIWRGVAGRRFPEEHQPQRILARMRTGPLEYGQGIYGNGWYSSVSHDVARGFGTPAVDPKTGELTAIAPESIQRMVLRPDARVADYDTLLAELRDRRSRGEIPEGFETDLGRYAALRGYDAIRVAGKHDANNPTYQDQYVLLNRTAVLFQEPGS